MYRRAEIVAELKRSYDLENYLLKELAQDVYKLVSIAS